MKPTPLYALDFDGVICNSAVETAKTGWKVAQKLWPDMQGQDITDKNILDFTLIRPCLETGYEAILIMRLLQQGTSFADSCLNYQQQLQELINDDELDTDILKEAFGTTRDQLIVENEAEWVDSNPLFDGITEKLKQLKHQDWVIVTTKQERFVHLILQANDIQIDETHVFGLDRKISKQEVLTNLKAEHPDRLITFIEDRLPTLFGVQNNPELKDIKLQLVDWGFNTSSERVEAAKNDIDVISMNNFLSP